ncbi:MULTISPECIES: M50 family metallopeptidase [Thalassotalea]|uniref:M50 family metallopeptidase n=1 Tax=Thalassotalea castellviae TaxID=3075612 RepID=A0ABU2ZYM6_9GAMM|nr:M50 family metallopeptidase [Thalassotalea sp. W431]MDT0602447.1 M50 family metallopeptidase [Thalassotalea sp. W431]
MSEKLPSTSFFNQYRFWIIFLSAALLLEVPIVSLPLKWFESYFHEVSHGIAALVTGGSIINIQLFPNGAGLCTTQGGNRLLISFFGYAGAVFWGVAIYYFAAMHQRIAQIFSAVILILLLSTIIFWIRDLLSFAIMAVLLVVIVLKFKLENLQYFQILLQLIGTSVLLNSLKSPWYLIDGRSIGDGASLAQLTGIPEFVWVCIWFTLGGIGVLKLTQLKPR